MAVGLGLMWNMGGLSRRASVLDKLKVKKRCAVDGFLGVFSLQKPVTIHPKRLDCE